MNLIFCLQINTKGFFKLLLSFQVCVARHVPITRNNKFVISLQYPKNELSDKVDFLHTDKHESLLQIDNMILMEMVKHSQSFQNSKFAMSLKYLKKRLKMKLIFCMQINIKVFCKFISTLWASKFPTRLILSLLMGMIKHSQITQSNKFARSLQYLKKEVRNEGHFWHADKLQSFQKLVLFFWKEVTRHVQNTQNRKLVVFLQYVNKNYRNSFQFYCDAKHPDILPGPAMFVFTCNFMILMLK